MRGTSVHQHWMWFMLLVQALLQETVTRQGLLAPTVCLGSCPCPKLLFLISMLPHCFCWGSHSPSHAILSSAVHE